MLTKEEFILLYEKLQAGQCTPEEIELLNGYHDDLNLLDDSWDNTIEQQRDVQNRVWDKLSASRGITKKQIAKFPWLKIAAILLVALTIGISYIIYPRVTKQPVTAQVDPTQRQPQIAPGGNKAFLTIANGSTITLTGARNGKLVTQAGIQVNKAKDCMLVYHFDKVDNTGNAEVAMNTITTPRGGQYQVILADGTKVWLNAASSLRFPVAFTGNTRDVALTGEGYFEVAKNKEKPFIVTANGTKVEVLGTHFDISAYSDDSRVTTTLLEGSVRLVKANAITMLTPGQEGISLNGQVGFNIQAADIEQTIAWKNGFFVFKNTDIKDIMTQAARWYDIEVDYPANLKNKEYGGKISRYKDISELMRNLELTGTIHFKVEGRRVTVMQ